MLLKENCQYSLLVPTSMGVRITPVNGQPVHRGGMFMMQATSAETNVATVAAYLGLPVKVLTTFVKGSPIADFIRGELRRRNITYEGPEVAQGGPWGYRHQINIADAGFGVRVLYQGGWGFAAGSDLGSIPATFARALDNAKSTARRLSRPIRLADKQVHTGRFTSPCLVDRLAGEGDRVGGLTPDLGHADSSTMLGKRESEGWQGRTTRTSSGSVRWICTSPRRARPSTTRWSWPST